jgi:NAD(P)-dependent dehydrogenase (short-subunit alcohol dehydrogenase family)
VLAGRDADRLARACAALGGPATAQVLDVTDRAAMAAVFERIGPFDHLVTAAAGTLRGRVDEVDPAAARALFDSKFWGQHDAVALAARRLRPGGSVVLFSGWIARKPEVGTGTLAAVDAAVEALARVLSLELAPLRVNAVCPGIIDTGLWASRLPADERQRHFDRVAADLPVGRVGTAEDVAAAVLFLLTNRFVTGSVLDVDGGRHP